MGKVKAVFLALFFLNSSLLYALPKETGAPEQLRSWRDWVLHGYEEQYFCPMDEERPICSWPVTLSLDLDSGGGTWVLVMERKIEGRIPLPGGPGTWPREARLSSGESVAVLGTDRPWAWLPAGRHSLSGRFSWRSLPETIDLPLGFVLDLKVDGRPLDFPALEVDYGRGQARLWLKSQSPEELQIGPQDSSANRLSLSVNRLLRDSQPLMVQSRFKLIVSGQARGVLLPNVLLPDTRAISLSSPLPAQLTADGLRVKVKPGVYEIFVDSRSVNRSQSLGPVAQSSPEPELWAFEAQPQLRQVSLSGAEQIDPSQADVYGPWRNYPVYLVKPGESLVFTTLSRGDPEPPPNQLRLIRECWLDYNGRGMSCRDQLSGTLSRQWHLNTSPPFSLSQASLNGQPQVITWQTDSKGQKAPGLQLREGRVDLRADLRIDDFDGTLPASGWDQKLDTEGQKLNLPPGYRLFHVSGADAKDGSRRYSGSGTWTGAWGTLDFFIVLIISIAVCKLYGRKWGLLALLTLVFCYHEPLAPRMVFLHLLACAALWRILPAENKKIRFLVRSWRFIAAVTLIGLTSLFLINQVRVTLYPQLENPRMGYGYSFWDDGFLPGASSRVMYSDVQYSSEPGTGEMMLDMIENQEAAMETRTPDSVRPAEFKVRKEASRSPAAPVPAQAFSNFSNRMVKLSQAPDAKVQNSIPRPDWSWRSARLYYNGSVPADQEIRLYLVGPTWGRLLGLMRIALISLFTLFMLDFSRRFSQSSGVFRLKKVATLTAMGFIGLLLAGVGPALAEDAFPEQEMLDQYRSRLLETKDLPSPGLSRLLVKAEAEKLGLEFSVDAGAESIVALPSLDQDIFRPDQITIDGRPLPLVNENGRWLALVPEGRHQLILSGRLKKAGGSFRAFQINFPPDSRPQYTELAEGSAWRVEGIERNGQLSGAGLFLTALNGETESRALDEDEDSESFANVTLDPFFLVHRTISLGLEWKVNTNVQRITPLGAPVSLRLPLLEGERPLTADGFKRDEGFLTINFGPQQEQVNWESSLDDSLKLTLKAEDGPWSESWWLDVSPIWRVKYEGLTPIHNTNNGFWQPQWRPWPGESLTLTVDRPEPVPGGYLVLDRGRLAITVGENSENARLNFTVRSSQGGPFSFKVPAGVEVREFKVNGRTVPLTPGGGTEPGYAPILTAPLSTGSHEIEVSWVKDTPLKLVTRTPELDLGLPSANLSLSLTMPENRWIIWTWGPLQGPAIQAWPLVAVVLLASVILGRFSSTPLSWSSWFLLGLGLIQLNIIGAMIVAAWLWLLGRRERKVLTGRLSFNFYQLILVAWTALALFLIYESIKYGLLQNPDMLISGGDSYGQRLGWFVDRNSGGSWPVGGAFTVSIWIYKALMLAWSLWLAVSLVGWLKWSWRAFSREAVWKKRPARIKPGPEQPAASTAEAGSEKEIKKDGE